LSVELPHRTPLCCTALRSAFSCVGTTRGSFPKTFLNQFHQPIDSSAPALGVPGLPKRLETVEKLGLLTEFLCL
jgi:hypothetical protein